LGLIGFEEMVHYALFLGSELIRIRKLLGGFQPLLKLNGIFGFR
jgi:hypothetical protein